VTGAGLASSWSGGQRSRLRCGRCPYCRACYDFTRRYGRGECAGCRRVTAVKKGHCRLCWLQAGIAAAGRRRITREDFEPAGYWQLSLAGMSRLGSTGPAPGATAARHPPPAGPAAWTQLELRAPGDSRHFGARHWAASRIDGEALALTRRIASELAATRGWNARIVIETGRALAVVLADHTPGDMIAWSQLPPALHRRDLSITRTAEILDLAGLLDDDRVSSFTTLMRARLALLPAPMAAGVRHWLRTRRQGGPRSRPRDEHTVRMDLNRVHPLLPAQAGTTPTCAKSPPPTSSPPPGPCPRACAGRPSPPCARCSATPRRPAPSSATPPAASATPSVP
jgi:hypothetical protein